MSDSFLVRKRVSDLIEQSESVHARIVDRLPLVFRLKNPSRSARLVKQLRTVIRLAKK